MTYIAYRTGKECIGKIKGYYVFHNAIMDTYGVTKDDGQDLIYPPHCGYYSLNTLLKFKGIPQDKINSFITQVKKG